MFDMTVSGLLLISLVALGSGLGACATCVVLSRRIHRISQRTQELLTRIEGDQRLATLALKSIDSRVVGLERKARNLKAAQFQLESRGGGTANYGQAITLVKRGWRLEDLISNCGLTRGEAELVYLLHGPGGSLNGNSTSVNNNI